MTCSWLPRLVSQLLRVAAVSAVPLATTEPAAGQQVCKKMYDAFHNDALYDVSGLCVWLNRVAVRDWNIHNGRSSVCVPAAFFDSPVLRLSVSDEA
jgi:hypothetical protein